MLLRSRHESMIWVFKRRHTLVPQRHSKPSYEEWPNIRNVIQSIVNFVRTKVLHIRVDSNSGIASERWSSIYSQKMSKLKMGIIKLHSISNPLAHNCPWRCSIFRHTKYFVRPLPKPFATKLYIARMTTKQACDSNSALHDALLTTIDASTWSYSVVSSLLLLLPDATFSNLFIAFVVLPFVSLCTIFNSYFECRSDVDIFVFYGGEEYIRLFIGH